MTPPLPSRRRASTPAWGYSREALHSVEWLYPVTSLGHSMDNQLCAFAVPTFRPDVGDVETIMHPPRARHVAPWLHGMAGIGMDGTDPETRKLLAAMRVLDWTPRPVAADRRQKFGWAREVVAAALERGLQHQRGRRLAGHQRPVWAHLVARLGTHADRRVALRVCDQCLLVFSCKGTGRPPRRCPACSQHPVRITLYPVSDGGWHTGFRVGPVWGAGVAAEAFRVVYYTGRCVACGGPFQETIDPRLRHCANCTGNSTQRARRSRGGSRTGRQRYRFTGPGGPVTGNLNVTLGERTFLLAPVDGRLETDDAELAKHLRSSGFRRIDNASAD
jgi:hypothetical protein